MKIPGKDTPGGGGSYGSYTTNPNIQNFQNTVNQNSQYTKPPNYQPVQAPQWQPDKTNHIGQAYDQLSSTGAMAGAYEDIFKNMQRMDPYGSGLSQSDAYKEMMKTTLGYAMPYAGQQSAQGFQGGMQNVQNQFGANMAAQGQNANFNQMAGQNAFNQQGQLAGMGQQQFQWGNQFGAGQNQQTWENQFNTDQANQAQENWQDQFDWQTSQGGGAGGAGGYPGTNFVNGIPDFSFPGGAGGSVAGSINPSAGGGWGGWGVGSSNPWASGGSVDGGGGSVGGGWAQPGQNVPIGNGYGIGYEDVWGGGSGGYGSGVGGGW